MIDGSAIVIGMVIGQTVIRPCAEWLKAAIVEWRARRRIEGEAA